MMKFYEIWKITVIFKRYIVVFLIGKGGAWVGKIFYWVSSSYVESKRSVRKGRGVHVWEVRFFLVIILVTVDVQSAALAGSRSWCWVLETVFFIPLLPALAALNSFTFGPHRWTTISTPPFSSFDFTAGISVATIWVSGSLFFNG